jgi:hypothetical protein
MDEISMFPSITSSTTTIGFSLPKGYQAVLLGDIDSPGMIQYHHLFLVFAQDGQICLAVSSEWNKMAPENKETPILGCFVRGTHINQGQSLLWIDDALFLLEAVKTFREQMEIADLTLSEGEQWALSQIRDRFEFLGRLIEL